jgi:AcrR family transcriptional regulator
MSRTVNEKRPVELLDAVVRYLIRHGIAEGSLRPLAKAVGSSPRVLLYYFGSKEKMIVRVLAEIRRQQHSLYGSIEGSFEESCWEIWRHMSAPESEPFFDLFFEALGMALRQRRLYREFLRATIGDWMELVERSLRDEGVKPKQTKALATIVIAGFRGFMLDYCATRDRERVDQAVRLWLRTLRPFLQHDKEVKLGKRISR